MKYKVVKDKESKQMIALLFFNTAYDLKLIRFTSSAISTTDKQLVPSDS